MILDVHFFKEENSGNAAEFKRCLPVNVNTSYVSLAPSIAVAEQDFIVPVLGDALFATLAAYYAEHGVEGDNAKFNEVILMIQFATVHLAYWNSFDQLAVNFSDTGIKDVNGEHRAYRYQADALKESLHRQGMNRVKQLVSFIEANIGDFGEFSQSKFYAIDANSLIKTTSDFSRMVPIEDDFRRMTRLRPYITTAEQLELPYRIGGTLAALVLQQDVEARFAPVMPLLRMFVANWAMAEAAPLLGVDGDGLVEQERAQSGGRVKSVAPAEKLEYLASKCKEKAERYIGTAVVYFKNNRDVFPEIAEIGGDDVHEHSIESVKVSGRGKVVGA